MRLSDLWRQTLLRRIHPSPLGPPASCSDYGQKVLQTKRERAKRRNRDMRVVWATCSAAVFLLGEMGGYFEGEVAGEAWEHLHSWITQKEDVRPDSGHLPNSRFAPLDGQNLSASLNGLNLKTSQNLKSTNSLPPQPHDPQTLTNSHISFLTSLTHTLLLTDFPFCTSLRSLLQSIDTLVAHLHRLQSIQESSDLEEDEGVIGDVMVNLETEERDCWREVIRGVNKVDSGCKGVVGRLRELDQEGGGREEGLGRSLGIRGGYGEEGTFLPWRGGGVERLLMRLERGTQGEDGNEGED
jgi:hypothetical protein